MCKFAYPKKVPAIMIMVMMALMVRRVQSFDGRTLHTCKVFQIFKSPFL